MENTSEEKLRELVNSNKNKSVIIDNNKYWVGKKVKEAIKARQEKEGGLLPLAALIPAIIGGLSGAASIAGGVATAVQKSKEAQKTDLEKKKLEEEIKKIKGGKGLYLNPYQGKGISSFLKRQIEQSDISDDEKNKLKDTCKSLKKGCLCKIKETKHGDALYLKPYLPK